MRVWFVSPWLSRKYGGIFEAERLLGQALIQQGVKLSAVGLRDAHTTEDRRLWGTVGTTSFRPLGPASIGWAPKLNQSLLSANADLFHSHGLWTCLSRATNVAARRRAIPYVVSPHGMLDAWALRNSQAKKIIAAALYERRHLRDAACLHALNASEATAIRAYGLRNPISIIANGVDLPQDLAGDDSAAPWMDSVPEGQKVLLYLGRIHPKKGLANLIRAWTAQHKDVGRRSTDWALVIAGWDQGDHAAELKQLVTALSVDSSVHFIGPVFDHNKAAAYRHASAFVLPSLSEGLPLVVLEAWSYRLPVIMTPACNLPEGFAAGAAISAQPEMESLAEALQTLFAMDDEGRKGMGRRGYDLVAGRFTWPNVAREMKSVYEWVLGNSAKPSCVLEE